MDDNNKYNKSKDYEPDNFDDEVAFPTRRSNPAKSLLRITATALARI